MTITFSLSQIHAIPPLTFYKSELHIPAFRKGGWIDGGLCPFHSDRASGSFRINTNSGAFKCFSCCTKGGDIIAFVQCRYGLSFKDAVERFSTGCGINHPTTKLIASKGKSDEEELENLRRRIRKANIIWKQTIPITETLAELYLAGRGIMVRPPLLRYTDSLWNFTSKSKHPALVAPIFDASNITAVHAIFLTAEAQKISGDGIKPKLLFGGAAGSAVNLAPLQDTLILTEGIEDALSILQSCPMHCVWACCGTSGFANIIVPKTVKNVVIAADNDTAGTLAANKLALRLKNQGFIVTIVFSPSGKDFNEFLQGVGHGN